MHRAISQRRAIGVIDRFGGFCEYDIDFQNRMAFRPGQWSSIDNWLWDHSLFDLFHDVVNVELNNIPGTTEENPNPPPLGPADREAFWSSVETFGRLKCLCIPIDTPSAENLARLQRMRHLERLFVWNMNMGDAGFATVGRLTQLSHLEIAGDLERGAPMMVTASGIAHLADLPHLRELELEGLKLTDDALRPIGRLRHLRSLTFAYTPLTGRGLVHLAGLAELKALEVRTEDESEADRSLDHAALTSIATLSQLQKLKLPPAFTKGVTDRELELLTQLRELQDLDLEESQITNAGVRFLMRLPKLRDLNVCGTEIDASGLKELARHPSLQSVLVDGRVSAADLNAINATTKRLHIHRYR